MALTFSGGDCGAVCVKKQTNKNLSIEECNNNITIFSCFSGLAYKRTCTIGSGSSNEDFIQCIVIQILQNKIFETATHYCEIIIVVADSVIAKGVECQYSIDVYSWRHVPGEGELGWGGC